MKNGVLLRAANGQFDVLVTADKNMHHQQNFVGLEISVLVFPTNRAKLVRAGVDALTQSLENIQPGQKTVMDLREVEDWSKSKLDESGTNRGLGIIKQPSAQQPKLLSHHVQPQKGTS